MRQPEAPEDEAAANADKSPPANEQPALCRVPCFAAEHGGKGLARRRRSSASRSRTALPEDFDSSLSITSPARFSSNRT